MNVNETLHNFKVLCSEYVGELSADVYTLKHTRSGARLTYIAREDDNKTFSIAFKTPPSDNTGVFHIIEHSVLCGSRKYPVKDPFVELLKGSLNTFLNAITFSDKTMYPVASRNDKDFYNLVSIYLDAVFHPLAIEEPNAFMQEGWHYELDGESGELSYKGVVFNEMKGAYSSPDAVAERRISELLYAGTCYAYDSGGDPEYIPTLTYEGFKAAHAKYYHPSNSEIFLDGSVDLDSILPLIDSYLDEYDEKPDMAVSDFERASPNSAYAEDVYEISPTEPIENKTRITKSFIFARYDEPEKLIAARVLINALMSTNDSPVKKAIIDSGLCEELLVNINDGIYEPSLDVSFINILDGKEEELLSLFDSVLRDTVEKGIDRENVLAAINFMEFQQRERDFGTLPIGIVNAMTSLESLVYSNDATQNFKYEKYFLTVREWLQSDRYERLLCDMIIDNTRTATVRLSPSATLGEERACLERESLAKIKAGMSEREIQKIKDDAKRLDVWQRTEDTDDARATIPQLTLADISDKVTRVPSCIEKIGEVEVVRHEIKTNGIVYITLSFDVTDTSEEELSYLQLYSSLLLNLPTHEHTAAELQNLVKAELGAFDATTSIVCAKGETKLYLQVSASVLENNKDSAPDIIAEIINDTAFTDKAAIKSVIRQTVIANEESFASAGHQVAIGRVQAAHSVEAACREYYSGYEAHVRIKNIDKHFEEEYCALCDRISALRDRLLRRERLTVSIAGSEEPEYARRLVEVARCGGESAGAVKVSTLPKRNEGIIIPARISFAASGASLNEIGEQYTGSMASARVLLNYEYLWGAIRVQGGAYGAGAVSRLSGATSFYSYRDPTPERSIECYREIPAFLREFAESGADVTKYVIGALGDAEPIKTPRLLATQATLKHLSCISYEEECERRRSLISLDKGELLRLADVMERTLSVSTSCVVAGKETLDGMKDKLDVILEI